MEKYPLFPRPSSSWSNDEEIFSLCLARRSIIFVLNIEIGDVGIPMKRDSCCLVKILLIGVTSELRRTSRAVIPIPEVWQHAQKARASKSFLDWNVGNLLVCHPGLKRGSSISITVISPGIRLKGETSCYKMLIKLKEQTITRAVDIRYQYPILPAHHVSLSN